MLEDIRIFHISHIDNLASIIKEGGIWSDNKRIEHCPNHRNIGYTHIKERRSKRKVPVAKGGVLADYVPFYFASRSPMLYAIHKDIVPGYSEGQENIVYLVSTVEQVINAKFPFAFTDRHAELNFTEYSDDIKKLEKLVDFEIMKTIIIGTILKNIRTEKKSDKQNFWFISFYHGK